jgi:hypothetical protein
MLRTTALFVKPGIHVLMKSSISFCDVVGCTACRSVHLVCSSRFFKKTFNKPPDIIAHFSGLRLSSNEPALYDEVFIF